MSIEQRIDEVINEFEGIGDWEDRYRHIIELGKKVDMVSDDDRNDTNKIKGCQSQVWLTASLEDDKIMLKGDSDASIVRGIVALLLKVYSGSTPDEILTTKPIFLEKIGLREHLSMSRANGLTSMLKQISLYAYAFKAKLSAMNK